MPGPAHIPITNRSAIVSYAESQITIDAKPAQYWEIVMPGVAPHSYPKHWCGAFALACWKAGGVGLGAFWVRGKGFGLTPADSTKDPQPGDIAYFDQPFQHYAIVSEIAGDRLHTIDGNQSWGNEVARRNRRVKDATAFYSIARFASQGVV